ncbi:hypothetical protein NECAME_13475 [Necator americanus]|uniref:BLOC-1-related complex subunit 5 n=1 Tax=Necator americanus TaxID=51031 RepID=W2SVK4_NECAM|nr:hypothetical protein NECAME_13475 [Necator americanus]ETN73563.1 hypothetical protein NECAME_13475 [Necator americanus]
MGNEQSGSGSSPQGPSNSTFSFLSGRGVNSKKSKGIVVVSGGNSKVETVEDDEIYKRFQEIPRFLPIFRHAIGKKDLSPSEYQQRMSSRPLYKMATRFQQHLKICAKAISAEQTQITSSIKAVEASAALLTTALTEKKKASDNFVTELQTLDKLRDDILHIQVIIHYRFS